MIAGNVETSQAVTSALFLALGVQAAAQSTMNNTTWGDDRLQYYETICGGTGAGVLSDGARLCRHVRRALAHDELAADRPGGAGVALSGGARASSRIRAGSGGAGRFRGGDGVARRIRFLAPMTVAILSGPPGGAAAGARRRRAGRARAHPDRAGGRRRRDAGSADRREVGPGDVFWLETPGGGGYGGD